MFTQSSAKVTASEMFDWEEKNVNLGEWGQFQRRKYDQNIFYEKFWGTVGKKSEIKY